MITDYIYYGYAKDPFVYGSMTLALCLGTVYYFNKFCIWKIIRTLGIKCIHSKYKLFHTVFGVFLVFLNIYVWSYFFSGFFTALTYLGLDLHHSPLTQTILDLNYTEFRVPGYSFIEEKVQFESTEDFECNVVQFNDKMF